MSTSYYVDMKFIVWKNFGFFWFFWFLQWFFECFVYMPLVFLVFLVFWMVFCFFPVLKQNFEKNVLRQNIHFFVVVPPWLVTQNIAKRTYGIGKDITLSPGSWWRGVLFFRVSLNILRILLLRMIRHTLMIHGLHFLLMSRQLWYFVFMGNN